MVKSIRDSSIVDRKTVLHSFVSSKLPRLPSFESMVPTRRVLLPVSGPGDL